MADTTNPTPPELSPADLLGKCCNVLRANTTEYNQRTKEYGEKTDALVAAMGELEAGFKEGVDKLGELLNLITKQMDQMRKSTEATKNLTKEEKKLAAEGKAEKPKGEVKAAGGGSGGKSKGTAKADGESWGKEFNTGIKSAFSWGSILAGSIAIADSFKPLSSTFGGLIQDEQSFMIHMREIGYVTQGITGNFGEAQEAFQKIGRTVDITGLNLSKFQGAYLANLQRGVKTQKEMISVTKTGLHVSTMVGDEAGDIANTLSVWHMKMGLSVNQTAQLGRGIRAVARETGVLGASLAAVVKQAEPLIETMRNVGTLTADSASGIIRLLTAASKIGVDKQMTEMAEGASSVYNFFNKTSPQMKNLLIMIADATGRLHDKKGGLLSGTMMGTRAGQKDIAAGLEKKVAEILNGVSLKGTEAVDQWQNNLLQTITGYTFGELKRMQESAANSGKSLTTQMDELTGKINDQNTTAKQRLLLEKQLSDLQLGRGMNLVSTFQEAAEKSGDMNEAMAKFSTNISKNEDMMQDINDLGINTSDSFKMASESLMYGADKLKKAGGKDFTGEISKALSAGNLKGIKTIGEAMNEESQRLAMKEKKAADPFSHMTQILDTINERIRLYFGGAVRRWSGLYLQVMMIVKLMAELVAFSYGAGVIGKSLATFGKGVREGFGTFRTNAAEGGGGAKGAWSAIKSMWKGKEEKAEPEGEKKGVWASIKDAFKKKEDKAQPTLEKISKSSANLYKAATSKHTIYVSLAHLEARAKQELKQIMGGHGPTSKTQQKTQQILGGKPKLGKVGGVVEKGLEDVKMLPGSGQVLSGIESELTGLGTTALQSLPQLVGMEEVTAGVGSAALKTLPTLVGMESSTAALAPAALQATSTLAGIGAETTALGTAALGTTSTLVGVSGVVEGAAGATAAAAGTTGGALAGLGATISALAWPVAIAVAVIVAAVSVIGSLIQGFKSMNKAAEIFNKKQEQLSMHEKLSAGAAGMLTGALNFMTFGIFSKYIGATGTLTVALAKIFRTFGYFIPVLGPIMLVLEVLLGILVGIYRFIKNVLIGVWEGLVAAVEPVIDAVKEVINLFTDALSPILEAFTTQGGEAVGIFETIANVLGFIGKVIGGIFKAIGKIVGFLIKVILTPVMWVVKAIAFVVKLIAKLLAPVIKGIIGFFEDVYDLTMALLNFDFPSVGKILYKMFVSPFVNVGKWLWDHSFGYFTDAGAWLWKTISEPFAAFGGWLYDHTIGALISMMPGWLKKWLGIKEEAKPEAAATKATEAAIAPEFDATESAATNRRAYRDYRTEEGRTYRQEMGPNGPRLARIGPEATLGVDGLRRTPNAALQSAEVAVEPPAVGILGKTFQMLGKVVDILLIPLRALIQVLGALGTFIWKYVLLPFRILWTTLGSLFSVLGKLATLDFSGAWAEIKAFPGKIASMIWDAIVSIPEMIWDVLTAVPGMILEAFGLENIFAKIKETFMAGMDALFGGIWQGFEDGLSEIFSGIWEGIQSYASGIWEGTKAIFAPIIEVFTDLWDTVVDIFTEIGSVFSTLWDTIKSIFQPIISLFGGGGAGGVGGEAGAATGGFISALKTIGSAIGTVVKFIGTIIGTIFKAVGWVLGTAAKIIGGTIGIILKVLLVPIRLLIKVIGFFVKALMFPIKLIIKVLGFFAKVLLFPIRMIIKAFSLIGKFLGWYWNSIVKPAFVLLGKGLSWAWSIISWPFRMMAKGLGVVWGWVKSGFSLIGEGLSAAWDIISWPFEMIGKGLDVAWGWVESGFSLIGDGLSAAWDVISWPFRMIANGVEKVWNWIKSWFSIGEGIGGGLSGVWDTIKSGFSLIGKGLSWAWSIISAPFKLIGKGLGAAWKLISSPFKLIGKGLGVMWGGIKSGFSLIGSGLKGAWDIVSWPFQTMAKGLSVSWDWVKSGFSHIGTGLGWVWGKVKSGFLAIADGAWNLLKSPFELLQKGITEVANWISNKLTLEETKAAKTAAEKTERMAKAGGEANKAIIEQRGNEAKKQAGISAAEKDKSVKEFEELLAANEAFLEGQKTNLEKSMNPEGNWFTKWMNSSAIEADQKASQAAVQAAQTEVETTRKKLEEIKATPVAATPVAAATPVTAVTVPTTPVAAATPAAAVTDEFKFDPNGRGKSLGPAKARELQYRQWQLHQGKDDRSNQLSQAGRTSGTFINGKLVSESPVSAATPTAPVTTTPVSAATPTALDFHQSIQAGYARGYAPNALPETMHSQLLKQNLNNQVAAVGAANNMADGRMPIPKIEPATNVPANASPVNDVYDRIRQEQSASQSAVSGTTQTTKLEALNEEQVKNLVEINENIATLVSLMKPSEVMRASGQGTTSSRSHMTPPKSTDYARWQFGLQSGTPSTGETNVGVV